VIALRTNRIHKTAIVDEEGLLATDTRIDSHARLIGDVRTEGKVLIDCNVVIYGPVILGHGSYLGANCVVGFPEPSELTRILRTNTVKSKKATMIGRECVIRSGATIYSDVRIADKVIFGHNVVLREGVRVGKGTKLGTDVVIDGSSRIGSRVSIQTGVYICTHSTVEDGVFLGPCCVFTNDKYVMQKPYKLRGPIVKRGASIGANALLFPGVTIGEGAVVGSQAMVNSDVPRRTVFTGIPAKKLRTVPREWRSALLDD